MKRLAYLSGLAGLLGVTFLVIQQGWDDVAAILAQGGWPLLWLLPLHALPLLLDARGWQGLLLNAAPGGHAGLAGLWWVASVREAVNRLLPTASVGGELVGIRLTRLAPPDTTAVAASIVAEVLVTLFAQYLFTMAGVLMLLAAVPAGGHGLAILAGLVLSLPLPILFAIFVRRGGIFEKLENAARRMLGAGHKLAAMVNGARLVVRAGTAGPPGVVLAGAGHRGADAGGAPGGLLRAGRAGRAGGGGAAAGRAARHQPAGVAVAGAGQARARTAVRRAGAAVLAVAGMAPVAR
jgi:hypothetical protein